MGAMFLLPLQQCPLSSDSLFIFWLSGTAGDGDKREATEPETSPSEHLCFLNALSPKPGRSYVQHQGQTYRSRQPVNSVSSLETREPTSTFSFRFQASMEQARDQAFPPLPAPPAFLGRLASHSLLLQHLPTYYSYSCWAAAFYSRCFLIGIFSQMGEANRSFINPLQVAAKCVWGLYVIFVNEAPSGIEPRSP